MTVTFPDLDSTKIIIILLVLGIVALFIYFQWKGGNDYDFLDTLKDANGKTSIGAHFAWAFFVLAVWLIIVEGLKSPIEVWPWLRDALLISLGYRVATSTVAAIASRPPSPPAAPSPQTIGQQVVNLTDATAPAAPLPAAVSRVHQ